MGIPGIGLDTVSQELIKSAVAPASGTTPGAGQQDFSSVLKAGDPSSISATGQTNAVAPTQDVNPVEAADKTQNTGIKGILTSFANASGGIDDIMKQALSGDSMSPTKMLMLQASTFKVTFEMQAAAKLVETTSGAAKQLFQTQVG